MSGAGVVTAGTGGATGGMLGRDVSSGLRKAGVTRTGCTGPTGTRPGPGLLGTAALAARFGAPFATLPVFFAGVDLFCRVGAALFERPVAGLLPAGVARRAVFFAGRFLPDAARRRPDERELLRPPPGFARTALFFAGFLPVPRLAAFFRPALLAPPRPGFLFADMDPPRAFVAGPRHLETMAGDGLPSAPVWLI